MAGKLDQLIAELCPNGVEYKTIGEIATDIYRGSGITRNQVTDDGIPCVRYGEIYTTYDIWFDKCISHTNESQIANKKYFEYGDILFAITGESVEEIAKSCAYVGHEKCLAGGDIVVLKHKEDPKYLAYALSTTEAQIQKSKGKVKSKVVHSSVPAIKEIKLPVPPLEVQREIVRVLDNFTFLTAELTAELTARRKQYEYYRSKLLTFKIETKHCKIGEIVNIYRGKRVVRGELSESKGYPVYQNSLIPLGYHDKANMDGDKVFVISAGAAGDIGYSKEPFWAADDCLCFDCETKLNERFLYHFLMNNGSFIKSQVRKSSVPRLSKDVLANMIISVPPIEIQDKIVKVLDNFDSICSDLNIGLPAEINARKKQYEYYRDFLLTFIQDGDSILTEQNRTEQNRTEQNRTEQN